MANLFTIFLGICKRLISLLIVLAPYLISIIWLQIRVVFYSLVNLLLASRRAGSVVSRRCPGHGVWPKYMAPTGREIRSPGLGLNNLAGHDILPRDGRHITTSISLTSANGGLMCSILGDNSKDVRVWLTEERFPDGWEPRNRESLRPSIVVNSDSSLSI
ncbi:hypothetical protein B0I35DRAFT_406876 [Stachybotrys elegans]|uniref:Heme haloperoxidase family profile domain-containing protein n=1 Tax=Stachybotrys elegans TaxID=80388 RepID=A0A8K0SUY9_9HYPO|nr:hypothetical protein B0I35DRAFT_406876 [Stachybotrys elegans]